MPPAIRIENLGKRYRVNHAVQRQPYRTLRDSLVSAATAPLRRFRGGGQSNIVEDFWALKDISFDVQPGEVVGIIGRNGAGKSTLLKILSRITKPTTGHVTLRGRVGSLLEVGTGFHPELTGRENVYLNGGILGMSRKEIERNFDAIVDFSGVEKFLDTPVKRYSSGMQVRLAFAVAAHLEPEILIVDEVLAVGDAEFQKKCLGKMQEVAKGGRTILFVSHNVTAVNELCESAICLQNGNIVQRGDVSSVVDSYIDSFVRHARSSYISSSLENDEAITLMRADVCNSNGVTSRALRFREPFSFRMLWRHSKQVAAASYSIRVFDRHSRLLFATNTIGHKDFRSLDLGDHSVWCDINPNLLVPGWYTVSIGAFVRPYGAITDLEACVAFEVESIPAEGHEPFLAAGHPAIAAPAVWIYA